MNNQDTATLSAEEYADQVIEAFDPEWHGTADHIDYVVIPPGPNFYLDASALVTDGCAPVNRFATTAPYALAFQEAELEILILAPLPAALEDFTAAGEPRPDRLSGPGDPRRQFTTTAAG